MVTAKKTFEFGLNVAYVFLCLAPRQSKRLINRQQKMPARSRHYPSKPTATFRKQFIRNYGKVVVC